MRVILIGPCSFQLPPSCNWQLLRDKFREMGEVKHAEMHSPDTGIVRFAAEKDAELAISKWSLAVDFYLSLSL